MLAPEAVLASYQEMVEVSSVAKNDFLYDLTMVKAIGKDNPDFLTKMVALFLEQMAEDLANILLLSQSGQWELVSKLAHRMKPSIEGMGINLLVKPIHELEVRVRYSEPISAAELLDLVDFIKIGLEKVFVQLRASFPGGL